MTTLFDVLSEIPPDVVARSFWKHLSSGSKRNLRLTCTGGAKLSRDMTLFATTATYHGWNLVPLSFNDFLYLKQLPQLDTLVTPLSSSNEVKARTLEVLTMTGVVLGASITCLNIRNILAANDMFTIAWNFSKLKKLVLCGNHISSLEPLACLSALTDLQSDQLDEDAFWSIGHLTQLQHIYLSSHFPDESFHFSAWLRLTNLVSLSLISGDRDSIGGIVLFSPLFALRRLTSLQLASVLHPCPAETDAAAISAAFSQLQGMSNLQSLQLGMHGFDVDDEALTAFGRLPKLISLGVRKFALARPYTFQGLLPGLRGLFTEIEIRPSEMLAALMPFMPLNNLEVVQDVTALGDVRDLRSGCPDMSLDWGADDAVEQSALSHLIFVLTTAPNLRLNNLFISVPTSQVVDEELLRLRARLPKLQVDVAVDLAMEGMN